MLPRAGALPQKDSFGGRSSSPRGGEQVEELKKEINHVIRDQKVVRDMMELARCHRRAEERSVGGAGDGAGRLLPVRHREQPVSLPRQKSAMLPIVTQEVEGTKVSIYNQQTHPKFPLLGLKFKNTTDLHLMQGPITVFEGSSYAGEVEQGHPVPDDPGA